MPGQTVDPVARFWARLDRSGDCWRWTGNLTTEGYGKLSVEGKQILAHRFSYELLVKPIPPGLHIDHLCRVHECVNPCHLEPVTPQQNNLRGVSPAAKNAMKTACPQGHPYAGENLIVRGRRRHCRACESEKYRRYRARKAEREAAARITTDSAPRSSGAGRPNPKDPR